MEMLQNSVYFGVLISLGSYAMGMLLKRKTNWTFMNPLLVSIVLCIIVITLTGTSYKDYNAGASWLSYLLTPATVCLAVPLYQQMELLKKNWKAIMGGIISGVLSSAVCILVLCLIFHLEHYMFVTLLPKSITTAIGMGVSEELNGIVTITVAVIIITGVVGNVLADFVYKLFHVTHPVAKGVGLGTSAHAIGTAKALEMGEIEGAMGSLAIAVAGLLTAFIIPILVAVLPL